MLDTAPIIDTKLSLPPARAGLVPRPRLTSLLDRGVNGPLTLLCAPAGFGKTALLAEWIEGHAAAGSPLAVGWLCLEADDNDAARFLAYLAAALDRVRPGATRAVQDFIYAPRPVPLAPRRVMARLIAALTSSPAPGGGAPAILVLDDYQAITAPGIHDALAYLLDHLPADLRVVVATRADPCLPLARLRARGQLVEIRAASLRFSLEETERFINGVMGLALGPAQLAALEAHTEGWPAGLQLAALAMQAPPAGLDDDQTESRPVHHSSFVAKLTGSHRYVVDYLAEEVIAGQPAEVRDFLLRTCLLRRLCAPLCDAVMVGARHAGGLGDASKSQMVLDHLDRNNLFLMPLDGERRWFRYHPLFAEALVAVARPSPEAAAETHRQAAGWFAAHGAPNEAVWHALAAGDFAAAADIVQASYAQMIQRGELVTVQRWLAGLPQAVVEQRPRLELARAWSQANTASPTDFDRQLDQVASAAAALPPDECRGLRGEAAALRAVCYSVYWRAGEAVRLAQEALELLP
ncbi:MAG: hypothetical protein IT318_05225, partial [Anaerolineales bacterium]|nr:hypothetical protein [Anaerolineales bacterium]